MHDCTTDCHIKAEVQGNKRSLEALQQGVVLQHPRLSLCSIAEETIPAAAVEAHVLECQHRLHFLYYLQWTSNCCLIGLQCPNCNLLHQVMQWMHNFTVGRAAMTSLWVYHVFHSGLAAVLDGWSI